MARLAWKLLAVALGAALAGCGDEDDDTDTGSVDQPEYGVEDVAWVAPEGGDPGDLSWDAEEA